LYGLLWGNEGVLKVRNPEIYALLL
jgi:hypothetical protein